MTRFQVMIAVNFEVEDPEDGEPIASLIVDPLIEYLLGEPKLHYIRFYVQPITHTGVDHPILTQGWTDRTPYPPAEGEE